MADCNNMMLGCKRLPRVLDCFQTLPPDKDFVGTTLVIPTMLHQLAHAKRDALSSNVLQEFLSHFKVLVGEEL
ncbi:hypothetical protein PPTG_24057 [Phytophthora nicotianae INRA-310]|uniref:Uncharacterized protein n=1 Tax=Phytophthora nicotianae (strain INRA-310) TaxID=761204 RepID=W2PLL2_PHYN3|nr:hypothetical protein PPTG_24057 [Phytophthora nicotianae INRA-310]ETN01511.1 hypothetical protein PPTG_24057 [Phytophthora nicotianae INRA-310]